MSGVSGGYNSPSGGGTGGNGAASASITEARAIGSSTPVEHAGSTGSGDGGVDVGVDPASHNFFSPDYRNSRHEDLRQMLEGNKDQQKLEAMKRIIGMVAKGKDASDLFPAVVKNVVSKNIEIKKLVYVYLVRYAEEQQDLALLSISTFQRALKDPNQLIRASALRVLSSIRVSVIVPIMMLAIKESASDMSPYVRKTAAVAIPKMYSLDPEQKEECVQVIEKLLADKTTLVAGAVVAAFEEVCPDRIDLIHKNYRKLCALLVDVDEWGQVIIINMLTRYARTQFVDPNTGQNPDIDNDDPKNFYESDSKDSPAGNGEAAESTPPPPRVAMDPDHRLLLRTCKPLLQSRNNAVVMAVAQLYYYLAPRAEVALCVRALVRLLRSHREGQYVVLSNIVSMSLRRKDLFEPYLKSFFVRSNSDPLHIRLLKLEILTNLATEANISAILREFQTYISQTDKEFVAATIQAIGRCASNIKGVSDTCLNGLVSLLSKKDEAVVAESVVVVKKLLQTQPSEHKAIITHMAKLVHDITVPMARASILWLLGEYSDQVPKIAPDVLRVMAKNFTNEEDIVKLQILNLAAKLHITNAKQTSLLAQYVFQLAKYDQNYDLRDRARFLRMMIVPEEDGGGKGALAKHAKKIFLSTKPAPVLESKFKDSDQFQLGTLSHIIGSRANGYQALPDFPETAPDPSVRVVEVASPIARASIGIVKTVAEKSGDTERGFYSESEEEDEDEEEGDSSGTTESADSGEEDGEESESGEEEGSESESEEEKAEEKPIPAAKSAVKDVIVEDVDVDEDSDSDESDDEDDEDEEEEDEDDSEEEGVKPKKKSSDIKSKESSAAPPATPSSYLVDLLDFDAIGSPTSTMPLMPSSNAGLLLAPKMAGLNLLEADVHAPAIHSTYVSSYSAPLKELLSSLVGGGLAVQYRFTRAPNLHSEKAATVELVFNNGGDEELAEIKIGERRIPNGMNFYEFPPIASLPANGGRTSATIGIDFNDSIQKIGFDLDVNGRVHPLTLTPSVGELLRACTMSENDFAKEKKKLAGMNEHAASVTIGDEATPPSMQLLVDAVLSAGGFGQVPSTEENTVKMASKSMATSGLSLVTLVKNEANVAVTVNSEKLMFGSLLLKDVKIALETMIR